MCLLYMLFSNTAKIETVYNANNRPWQGIHDSITTVKTVNSLILTLLYKVIIHTLIHQESTY